MRLYAYTSIISGKTTTPLRERRGEKDVRGVHRYVTRGYASRGPAISSPV